MKKILLGIFLVAGLAAHAAVIIEGPAEYGSPSYRDGGADITTNDTQNKIGLVRRFRRNGEGWEDSQAMMIRLTVHEKVQIKPEYKVIKGEGVLGDKLSFGDITYKLKGTMPAEVTFALKGDLFNNPNLFDRATIKKEKNGNTKEIGLGGTESFIFTQLDFGNNEELIEMDLYFHLDEVSEAENDKRGRVVATARYL